MQCKCGYRFSGVVITKRKPPYETFAVIRDSDYRRFLKSEMELVQAQDRETKMSALSRSSQYIGGLFVCPQCSRLVFSKPIRRGEWQLEFYREDMEAQEE